MRLYIYMRLACSHLTLKLFVFLYRNRPVNKQFQNVTINKKINIEYHSPQ